MLSLKACPKCHGDMIDNNYADEMACLQCGYVVYRKKPLKKKPHQRLPGPDK